jgi:hypothetical protein
LNIEKRKKYTQAEHCANFSPLSVLHGTDHFYITFNSIQVNPEGGGLRET